MKREPAVPALVLAGGASPQSLQAGGEGHRGCASHGQHRTLNGQTHDVAPDTLAPVLVEFFGA